MITLTEFKSYNKITDTTNDSLINICISGSIKYAENYCNRKLVDYTNEELYNGNAGKELYLNGKNITSVTFISQSLNDDYEFTNLFTEPDTTLTHVLINNESNSIILKGEYYFSSGYKNINIRYKSGYLSTTTPYDLKIVLLEIATHFYNQSAPVGVSRLGIKSMNMGSAASEGQNYMDLVEMNNMWRLTLDNYKLILI